MELRRMLAQIADDLAHTWYPQTGAIFAARSASELLRRVEDLRSRVEAESLGPRWWAAAHPDAEGFLCAYFSAEFGLSDELPIFAGGLGVLAGDHLKSACELGVPLVGVGLWYSGGYFRQGLSPDGWQTEEYPRADPALLPVEQAVTPGGDPAQVTVELAGERVSVRAWRVRVGSISLYLLDTDVAGNSPAGREITGRLYAGDRELRIRQEIVLGVGGIRALRALGLAPTVFHMNEGHSAFLALERVRELVDRGHTVDEALGAVRASTVFTTHTPAPAGNEVFERRLVERYLTPLVEEPLRGTFAALGLVSAGDSSFGMTPLALRTSGSANGVSRLHGEVARGMWAGLGGAGSPDVPRIGHVTNGVHPRTWLSAPLAEALVRAGVRLDRPPEHAAWDGAHAIADGALWHIHTERKRALLDAVRGRLGGGGATAALDPDALTIGFARRFATYKRADLLFSLPDRLERLLADDRRPVQLLVAGKAHPQDDAGKALIQAVVRRGRGAGMHGRIAFLPGYDMDLARLLVQGCDLWLNTPRRPFEASGTSGMKAALNGVPNCSILDGWWDEGFTPETGFAIGGRGAGLDDAEQDRADARALHDVLADQVVPRFYDRDGEGLPRAWVAMMRAAVVSTGKSFTSERMVRDYVEGYYVPAHAAGRRA